MRDIPGEEFEEPGIEDLYSEDTLREMRRYVDFVENALMPSYRRITDAENSYPLKVGFYDLAHLFRAGDLLYAPLSEKTGERRQKIWRVFDLWTKDLKKQREIRPLFSEKAADEHPYCPTSVVIDAYYLDFDGDNYQAVREKFEITYFPGMKIVNELEFYPLRFAKDYDTLRTDATTNEQTFVDVAKELVFKYEGWTVTSSPNGNEQYTFNEDVKARPLHVDSDVIIDFKETFQRNPAWKPPWATIKTVAKPNYDVNKDNFAIYEWSNRQRSEMIPNSTFEYVVEDDQEQEDQWNDCVIAYPLPEEGKAAEHKWIEDDLMLLPSRVLGYALRERKSLSSIPST